MLADFAEMDPLLAARQASHAAASSSQSGLPYPDFNLPVYSTMNGGFPPAQHLSQEFEHVLSCAHEHYRGRDYHKALQLCQSVSLSELGI